MMHRHCFEALDRSLRDVLENEDEIFGGIPVVLGGDFRQVLPVIPRAGRRRVVQSTLKCSYIWEHVDVLKLTENERAKRTTKTKADFERVAKFAKWLLTVGEQPDKHFELPSEYILPDSELETAID